LFALKTRADCRPRTNRAKARHLLLTNVDRVCCVGTARNEELHRKPRLAGGWGRLNGPVHGGIGPQTRTLDRICGAAFVTVFYTDGMARISTIRLRVVRFNLDVRGRSAAWFLAALRGGHKSDGAHGADRHRRWACEVAVTAGALGGGAEGGAPGAASTPTAISAHGRRRPAVGAALGLDGKNRFVDCARGHRGSMAGGHHRYLARAPWTKRLHAGGRTQCRHPRGGALMG